LFRIILILFKLEPFSDHEIKVPIQTKVLVRQAKIRQSGPSRRKYRFLHCFKFKARKLL